MFEFNADPQFIRNQQFHDACRLGDTQTAVRLLSENPDDSHLIDTTRSDMPAILMAASGHFWDLCKELIARGVNLNVKNKQGFSPIHVFAQEGHDELITLAVNNAAYVNRKNMRGETPLYFASRADKESSVRVLISLGGEVNTLTSHNDSPMHWAARNGNAALSRILIEHGAHVHGENDLGETPVSLATNDELRSELEKASLMQTVAKADEIRQAEAVANGEDPAAIEASKPKRRILKA